jgi:hypothetical protein
MRNATRNDGLNGMTVPYLQLILAVTTLNHATCRVSILLQFAFVQSFLLSISFLFISSYLLPSFIIVFMHSLLLYLPSFFL